MAKKSESGKRTNSTVITPPPVTPIMVSDKPSIIKTVAATVILVYAMTLCFVLTMLVVWLSSTT